MFLNFLIILIGSVLTIHLLYQLYFLIGLIRIPNNKQKDHLPGVSVIIAARNEFENLKQMVPLLVEQDYEPFEILIINDRSEDDSEEYLRKLEEHPKIKVVYVDHLPDHINSKKYALTLGIKAAKNDILLFTDADCRPVSDQWIKEMATAYDEESTEIVLGFSPYEPQPGFLNLIIRFEALLTGILYLSSAANGHPYMGVGRNLSYKKELFMRKKGFIGIQHLVGGDDDLLMNRSAKSSNTRIALSPECSVISVPKNSYKEYVHQRIRHLSVGKYYKFKDKFFIGLFSFVHISSVYFFILSLTLRIYPVVYGSIFIIGLIIFIMNFSTINRRSASVFSPILVPFIDVIYSFFYIFVGIRTVFTKKIKWKT